MNVSKLFAAVVLAASSASAFAQVEFRLAYMKRIPDSSSVAFSNDFMFKFVASSTFIGSKDMLRATASLQEGRGVVAIRVSDEAAKRFNELAKANLANQSRGVFENHVGLAVIVDGQATKVIQGVFEPLHDKTIWWRPADDRLPPAEQLRVAKEMARKLRAGSS